MHTINRSHRWGVRSRMSSLLIGTAKLLSFLALLACVFPVQSVAQAPTPAAKPPALWTDPETGQVFTKPGPGRVPFTGSLTPSNEPPTSQIQGLQVDTESLKQQLQALTSKDGIRYKGVNVKLGGFIEAAGIYRTRNEVSDVGSDYNQGIPFNNNPLAHENETRFSARQSRLSLLAQGDVSPVTHLAAYFEMDFLASGTTSNSRESNSYTPRERNIYATLDEDRWGLHFLAGQNWSLMTTNIVGIIPRQEQIPLTIDAQYVEGFNWLRVPQFRVVKDFGHGLWAGISAESPQVVTSPIGAPTAGVNYTNPGNPAGLLNQSTTYSNDYIPDFDGKIALDPGWGHYEFKTLLRTFTARTDGANRNATGYGFGGAAAMPIVPTYLDLQLSGLGGYGIGRYGSGQLPDAAFKQDNIHLTAVPEAQGLVGIIGHPWDGNDLYLYGGWEHADRAGSSAVPIGMNGVQSGFGPGYGSPLNNVSGCNQLSGVCFAESRDLQQITAGFWQNIYKGDFGRLVAGFQGGQIWRRGFSGSGGPTPRTNIDIFMTSLRYYPF